MTTKTKSRAGKVADNGVAPDFDFSHLDIRDATAEYKMRLVSPDAVLICAPALEFNEAYTEGLLSLSGRRDRMRMQALEGDFSGSEDMDRRDDVEIYPGTVIKGWRGIQNKKGQEVPFSLENCRAFLKALEDWLFERLRTFCRMPDNFVRSAAEIPPRNVGALVKN